MVAAAVAPGDSADVRFGGASLIAACPPGAVSFCATIFAIDLASMARSITAQHRLAAEADMSTSGFSSHPAALLQASLRSLRCRYQSPDLVLFVHPSASRCHRSGDDARLIRLFQLDCVAGR